MMNIELVIINNVIELQTTGLPYTPPHGGGGAVDSVNGKTGVVVLTASDVDAYTKAETDTLLDSKADKSSISAVGYSNNYNDLDNKPTIPTIPTDVSAFTNDAGYLTQHQDISGKVDKEAGKGLSTNDYSNADKTKVSLITASGIGDKYLSDDGSYKVVAGGGGAVSSVNAKTGAVVLNANDVGAEVAGTAAALVAAITAASIGAATAAQGTKADTALQSTDVAPVALSGSYNDLINKPTIPVLPTLATVATSGSYNDLTSKPDLTLKQDKLPTNGTAGQFLAHDMTFKTPAGGSTVNEYSATALASAWTGTNPSTLALTVTGLLATYKTVLDVDLSGVTFANVDGVQADYALIYRAVPTANTLTLYASKKPTKDLTLKLVVLNG